MAVLCGMPAIQHSAPSGQPFVHKLFTSCIRRCLFSVTCLRLSDVSVICRVTYLQFPIQACTSSMSVSQAARWRTWFSEYRTSDVAEILGKFLIWSVKGQENNFELILMAKIETRIPKRDHGSNFPAVCNHCGVMAA